MFKGRLTALASRAGCAAKMDPDTLDRLLRSLAPPTASPLVVDAGQRDDAMAWSLDVAPGTLLVQSVDILTPLVDDPADFGRIVAAHALSDLYAMGATPAFALNILAFPDDEVLLEAVPPMLRAAQALLTQAGAVIGGGHSLVDDEPKYGMVVTGFAPADAVTTLDAGRPGDVLVLTKPLGTGLVTGAIKAAAVDPAVASAAIEVMASLNDAAARAVLHARARCVTDVTGFGLVGHLHGLARASGLAARVVLPDLPALPGARHLADRDGAAPGALRNLAWYRDRLGAALVPDSAAAVDVALAFDPQTSGGLLVALAADRVDAFRAALAPHPSWIVGSLEPGPAGQVSLLA